MTLKLKNEIKNDKLFHLKYYLDNLTNIHVYNLVCLREKCTCMRLLPALKNPGSIQRKSRDIIHHR